MKITRKTKIFITAALFSLNIDASANTSIFNGNFNDQFDISRRGNQVTTELNLEAFTGIKGWKATGLHVNHLVDRDGTGDWAVMFFDGSDVGNNNTILSPSIAAGNILNQAYHVSFEVAPAVFSQISQATNETDGIILNVLDANSSVIKSKTFLPGSFSSNAKLGSLSFSKVGIDYIGTGLGENQVSLFFTANNPGASRFGGAIDNVSVSAVPEPATFATLLAGLGLMGFMIRRRKTL